MRNTDDEYTEVRQMIAREIPALRRYAHLLLPRAGQDRKDDLVQDTLERALKKRHLWRREGAIRSWLYRVQYSVFLNKHYKTHLREVSSGNPADIPSAAMPPGQEKNMELQRVMEAVKNMPPRRREVLLLIAVEGLSYDQAAAVMDIPVGTVRSRLSRAREELRAEMQKNTGVTVDPGDLTETPESYKRHKDIDNV